MAKLPDLRPVRSVPTLASPAAATAQNKIRNISAFTQAGQQALGAVSDVAIDIMDREARLDAQRRFNNAQRDTVQEVARITQEYHTDRNKPVDQYVADLQKARRNAFNAAQTGASGRARRYLDTQLDAYDVQLTADDVEVVRKLTESRTVMHLTDIQNDASASVAVNPAVFDEALEGVSSAWDTSGLAADVVQAGKTAAEQSLILDSIIEATQRGEMDTALKLQQSESYTKLPAAQRASLDAAIDEGVDSAFETMRNELGNALIANQMNLPDGLKVLENRGNALLANGSMTEQERADFIQNESGALAAAFFENLLIEGEYEQVLLNIDENTYGDVLSPDQSLRLKAAAKKQQAAGAIVQVNSHRAALSSEYSDIKRAAESSPEYFTLNDAERGVAVAQEIIESYAMQGKEAPEEAYKRLHEMERLYQDSQEITLGLYGDSDEVGKLLRSLPANADEANTLANVSKGWQERQIRKTTDPIKYARRDYAIPDLPPVGSPNYAIGIAGRLNMMPALQDNYGSDVAYLLDEDEAQDLNDWLKNNQGSDEFYAFASDLYTKLGEAAVTQLMDQLVTDEGAVYAGVFKLAAQGRPGAADMVLKGLSVGKLDGVSKASVIAEIREDLETAYGDNTAASLAAQNLIYNYALGYVTSPNGKTTTVDSGAIDTAIAQTIGKLVSFEGQNYLAPTPTTTQAEFNRWTAALSGDTLPPLYDAGGEQIPPSEFAYMLDEFGPNRFRLESTGTPGAFYLVDNRSRAERQGGLPGALLLDKNGTPAVIRYDPTLRGSGASGRQP